MKTEDETHPHTVSVVIPVYRGAATLPALIGEVLATGATSRTPGGRPFTISEILLVHDRGPDDSAGAIRTLADTHDAVRPIWLSRNFGQHAATLAGMASTATDWIVTMDEDGQHDPAAIPLMLDAALTDQAAVVYAAPTNPPSHGAIRNTTSAIARWLFTRVLSADDQPAYHSYRLVLGEVGRSVAAYGGSGVYLDVALGWVTQDFAVCPVTLHDEGDRQSGYSMRSLASHFWRLVLSSGTRPMRIMSLIGATFATFGLIAAVAVLIGRLTGAIDTQGWASLASIVLAGFGLVLFSLGIVAEYVGVTAQMAMGKPPYLIVRDQRSGPLGSRRHRRLTGMSTWILGRGGLLGGAMAARVGPIHEHDAITWSAPEGLTQLRTSAESFVRGANEPWTVVWAAGAGVVGTDEPTLRNETEYLKLVLSELAKAAFRGTVILASSAGGVYGGSQTVRITEATKERPLSDYGRNKLVQERLVADWARTTGNRGFIARIANLYGPGQQLGKAQGLISQVCKSTILRQPIPIYVSLDTLRDYLYVTDCADILIEVASRAAEIEPGSTVTKIVASGQSVSIGAILAETRRVIGRPATVVLANSPRSTLQGSALAFGSTVWPDLDARSLTSLPSGIHRTVEGLHRRLAEGRLAA